MTVNTAFGVSTPVNSRSINNAFDAVLNNGYDFSNIVATGTITAAGNITSSANIGWSASTYLTPVTGDANQFGSVKVFGTPTGSSWAGYSIAGNAVFMSDANNLGLYDQTNFEWALLYARNGATQLHFNGTSRFQTTNIGANTTGSHSFATGQGAVIKAIENRLVSGSNQSAAMYLGDGASGGVATGGIEVSWNTANNDPIIGIGVTRDSNNTKITMSYAGIIRMFSQGSEKMSITTSAVSFANGVTAPSITATTTLSANNTLNTFGEVQVYNPGISYPGASVGGGSSNQIGFRWASPVVNCTVDNVISAVAANFSDRRIKTNIQTLTNGMDLIRSLRCVTYNPLDVIGFEEETFEPIIGDLDPYDEMIGFIADEVQEVYANAVNGEGNRLKSIDNVQLLSMAISAIQQLDQRLTEMEAA